MALAAQDYRIQLAGIEEESIVDGPGIRLVIFTQGCPHHCRGCHNPKTHPYTGGKWYKVNDIFTMYESNPLLSGITFSGGEPFLHAYILFRLAYKIHAAGGDVVTYTGYTYEELLDIIAHEHNGSWQDLLDVSDFLIDGRYIKAKRDLTLLYRGSSNQRILTKVDREKIDAKIRKEKKAANNRPVESNQGQMS